MGCKGEETRDAMKREKCKLRLERVYKRERKTEEQQIRRKKKHKQRELDRQRYRPDRRT